MASAAPADSLDLIAADVLEAQLRAHAASAMPSSLASAGIAALLVLSLGAAVEPWRLGVWLAALASQIALRFWVRRAQRRAADAAAARWPPQSRRGSRPNRGLPSEA